MFTRIWSFFNSKPLPTLPPEVIKQHIFYRLPPGERQNREVSKQFRKLQDELDVFIMSAPDRLLHKLISLTNLHDLCILIRHFQTTSYYTALEKKFRENTLTEKEWLCFLITNNIDKFKLEDKKHLCKVTLEGFKNSDPYLKNMCISAYAALQYCDHDNQLGPDAVRLNWLQNNPPTEEPLLYYVKAKYLRFQGDETFHHYDFTGKSFPCINLSHMNLSLKDFIKTDFSFGKFIGTRFLGICDGLNLSWADLTGAHLERNNLQHILFDHAILTEINILSDNNILSTLDQLVAQLIGHPNRKALLNALAEHIIDQTCLSEHIIDQIYLPEASTKIMDPSYSDYLNEILTHPIFEPAKKPAQNFSQRMLGFFNPYDVYLYEKEEAWERLYNYRQQGLALACNQQITRPGY